MDNYPDPRPEGGRERVSAIISASCNYVIPRGTFIESSARRGWDVVMEYSRGSTINLTRSASLIHKNLCVARGLQAETDISYAVAHKATANIVHVSCAGGASRQQQETVDYESTKDKDPMAHITQVGDQVEIA